MSRIARRARGAGGIGVLLVPAVLAFAQESPGRAQAPASAWPQPDRLEAVLTAEGLAPRTAALEWDDPAARAISPAFLVLPVQTQGFGFAPGFRALVGAYLDQHIQAAGIVAPLQTDIQGAVGSSVRRIPDAVITRAAMASPGRMVLALYLGHDGATQMHATLVSTQASGRKTAHRDLPLPGEPLQALDALNGVVPAMLGELGWPAKKPSAGPVSRSSCGGELWTWAPLPRQGPPGPRACQAYLVGSLMPDFAMRLDPGSGVASATPARQAWLAQAAVLATPQGLDPSTALHVRQDALRQLGIPGPGGDARATAYAAGDRAVLAPLEQLKGLAEAVERSPKASPEDVRRQAVEQITQAMPPFARAVVEAASIMGRSFKTIDLCALERALPGTMLRAPCIAQAPAVPVERRPAHPIETALYREWQLAAHLVDLRVASQHLGSQARTQEVLKRWPSYAFGHPFLSRAVFEARSTSGSPDAVLADARRLSRSALDSIVDLQRDDAWLARYSMSEHTWADSVVRGDGAVKRHELAERRILAVLRHDRFQEAAVAQSAMPAPPPVDERVTATSTATPAAGRRQGFAPHQTTFDYPPMERLAGTFQAKPTSLGARADFAQGRLRQGGTLAEATELLDAHVDDVRPERLVQRSNEWGAVARWFALAGEPQAAQRYYRKVAEHPTGSAFDLQARARLLLLQGQVRSALEPTAMRAQRYDSPLARRDLVGIGFLLGRQDEAWQTFLAAAPTANSFPLWWGAYVGHRMASFSLSGVDDWLTANGLENAQADNLPAREPYLHLLAVTDRVPDAAGIELLARPSRGLPASETRWSASARLHRSALNDADHTGALAAADRLIETFSLPDMNKPLYAWVLWHATQAKGPWLDEVRSASLEWRYPDLLAKAMVLSLDGRAEEGLKFLKAARYSLPEEVDEQHVEHRMMVPYLHALGGYLIFRKTGSEAVRQEVLGYVKAMQFVYPYLGWLHAMQAVLERNPGDRKAAACRAGLLDPASHFLKLSGLQGQSKAACRSVLATLRR